MHRSSSWVSEGQNFSSVRYMDPITKILYHNYTIAACNLLYPNVVKLEDRSFQQYGETLKKFYRQIYQRSMKSNLIVSDENLHRSFFSTSDVKQSQIAWTIRHNSQGTISSEAFQDFSNKWNNNFSEFMNRKLINLVKSEGHCFVSLNSLPLFSNCEKFSQIVHLFKFSY